MPAKGYKKHKCKGCGATRSTAGDYCYTCIAKRLTKPIEKK